MFSEGLANHYLIFERNKRTTGWMLENCCLTGLTLSNFRGKTIVVVGRCIPYLITIFWRNQTVETIFSYLCNVTNISIIGTMLCCQKIENMLLTSSLFFNSRRLNVILLSSNVGRSYLMYFTLLVSPTLSPWLISSNWSLRPFNVTLIYRTLNIWGFPPLKCMLTLNKSVNVSNLHHKMVNNQWKTHSNISLNTWSANYT